MKAMRESVREREMARERLDRAKQKYRMTENQATHCADSLTSPLRPTVRPTIPPPQSVRLSICRAVCEQQIKLVVQSERVEPRRRRRPQRH